MYLVNRSLMKQATVKLCSIDSFMSVVQVRVCSLYFSFKSSQFTSC